MHSCWMMRETEFPQLPTENEMFFLFGLGNETANEEAWEDAAGRTRGPIVTWLSTEFDSQFLLSVSPL